MDSNQQAFEAAQRRAVRSYSMSFMEDLSALQLHPKSTANAAVTCPNSTDVALSVGSSYEAQETHFRTPALPQHSTTVEIIDLQEPPSGPIVEEPPSVTTQPPAWPPSALPQQQQLQHSPIHELQPSHSNVQVLHLQPTDVAGGGIVGDGLRAEAPSRRPGGGRPIGAFASASQPNGYVHNNSNLPTCLQQQQNTEDEPGLNSSSPVSFVVSPQTDDADHSPYLRTDLSSPPYFDQMLARRNSMPAIGSRRPSYPLQHSYTPLTEVPTLGRALAEGNVHQRKSIQSFLTTLAQHSLERTEKRRRERGHKDHSHKKPRRGRRDTLYSSSDSDEDDGIDGGENDAKGERSAPLLSPTLIPNDSPQQSFMGFDYASEAMAGFISAASIGGEQRHQETESRFEQLLQDQQHTGQPAFHLGQPPVKYNQMSHQAQNLHLQHQLRVHQLQLERKIQQRFPQRHSYPPSHSTQYSYPPEEVPVLVPMHNTFTSTPANLPLSPVGSPLFNSLPQPETPYLFPQYPHQPHPEHQPLQHSLAQEVVEQQVREAAAYKEFFDEFSGYEMAAVQAEVSNEPIKDIPAEVVIASGQVGSIEGDISVMSASAFQWIESNDTLTEEARADDIFNQIFNLDETYVAASM